jgi:hypothetical protein
MAYDADSHDPSPPSLRHVINCKTSAKAKILIDLRKFKLRLRRAAVYYGLHWEKSSLCRFLRMARNVLYVES